MGVIKYHTQCNNRRLTACDMEGCTEKHVMVMDAGKVQKLMDELVNEQTAKWDRAHERDPRGTSNMKRKITQQTGGATKALVQASFKLSKLIW